MRWARGIMNSGIADEVVLEAQGIYFLNALFEERYLIAHTQYKNFNTMEAKVQYRK